MKDEWMGEIKLSWDVMGRINHKLNSKYKVTEYEIQDALAYSALVCIASQLGVVSIRRSLFLCSILINFLESGKMEIQPINSALRKVTIELRRKKELYHLFHPMISTNSNNNDVEDGIIQFLSNYLYYAYNFVSPEFQKRLKNLMVTVLLFYLKEALGNVVVTDSIDVKENNLEVQKLTIAYSVDFYIYWTTISITNMPENKFTYLFSQVKESYNEVVNDLDLTLAV